MSRVIANRQGQPRAVIMAGLRGPAGATGVESFNGRIGVVTLTGADVTTALGYSPVNGGSLASVAFTGSYADLTNKPFIPASPGDIGAATAAQGERADTAVQPADIADVVRDGDSRLSDSRTPTGGAGGVLSGSYPNPGFAVDMATQAELDSRLAGKVDTQPGYGLSQENFTAAEKSKLAGLEGSHYRGTFVNLAALQAAIPAAQEGDYADVDAGANAPVQRYIWDDSDSEWVAQAGSADPITAAQVKTLYESNLDTNAYTDAEKSKLAGIAAGATANANTDSLAEGATNLYHTAARVLATVLSGLSLATGTAITSSDSVLVAFGKLQKQITDLIATVSGKQDTLVSGTNIKTINGETLLGSGNIAISGGGSANWGDIGGALADQTDLQAALNAKANIAGIPVRVVTASGAITPADSGYMIISTSATPITLTIGAEATAAWAISGSAPMIHFLQDGAGAVTITGDGFSMTTHASDTNVLDGQAAAATAVWRGTNTWRLFGRLVAA